jgi:3-deoxy-D-arabino-heptulosonate 7-phosphate (DAHP) synthase
MRLLAQQQQAEGMRQAHDELLLRQVYGQGKWANAVQQLIQIHTSTNCCFVAFCTWNPTTSIRREKRPTMSQWRGLVHDPDHNGVYNISKGLKIARQLIVKLSELASEQGGAGTGGAGTGGATTGVDCAGMTVGMPVALCDLCDTVLPDFYKDGISYATVGSEVCGSQQHRQLVSALECPVGFHQSIGIGSSGGGGVDGEGGCRSGLSHAAVDAMLVSARPHHFLGFTAQGLMCSVTSTGNASSHLIVGRGRHYDDQANHSDVEPGADAEQGQKRKRSDSSMCGDNVCHDVMGSDVAAVGRLLEQAGLPAERRVMVDCSSGYGISGSGSGDGGGGGGGDGQSGGGDFPSSRQRRIVSLVAEQLASASLPSPSCSDTADGRQTRPKGSSPETSQNASAVMGVGIKSNLVKGSQKLSSGPLTFGQSITDDCLDIAETSAALRELAAAVRHRRLHACLAGLGR